MEYTPSLEGYNQRGEHVQLSQGDKCNTFYAAATKANRMLYALDLSGFTACFAAVLTKHRPSEKEVKGRAIKDIWGDGRLFRVDVYNSPKKI